jgi:uncharacterized membrane protein
MLLLFIFLFIAKFDKTCRVIMRKEWGTLKVSALPGGAEGSLFHKHLALGDITKCKI